MKIFASQLRAARALLDVDQEVVSGWTDLDRREVSGWEHAKYKLYSSDAENLKKAFEERKIEFLSASEGYGAGVRWREPGREDRHRGVQFRAARAMANLSMRDLEDLSGVNRNFILRLERGKVGPLNVDFIRKLETSFLQKNIVMVPEGKTYGAGVRWVASPSNRDEPV
ncbi:XRE family transcriptional regulator [Rhizobium ruizarguesonis]|uniref:helix-turn-helix domain-containing protein n=1 Tax=Rhizobium ruizarguesonis TaxID=2081791 RepID=UPI00102F7292|nr:helix-turn-helix transcriptional regulator [Rhizobium ruizarguesonis]TAZ73890.1 XRE family transcriptional regulator [Rhizobium ruizarguesonis]TBA00492.1 XRE family transcriptional regulator [Rhizobium ruizarguesonis]